MTDTVTTVKDIQIEKNNLQKKFEQAQENLQNAQAKYIEEKDRLLAFNNQYGRVLQIIERD